jgi:hypothetical protein
MSNLFSDAVATTDIYGKLSRRQSNYGQLKEDLLKNTSTKSLINRYANCICSFCKARKSDL